jgi:dethiobiotin synthetase
MEIYFITATNTGIGKTKACELFLRHYAKSGKKVGYFKPFETGVSDFPQDGKSMLELAQSLNKDFNYNIDEIVPYQFKLAAAPYVSNLLENQDIDIGLLNTQIKAFEKTCDILIIEGAGGLMVPIKKNYFILDLIKDLKPTKTILIVPSCLGSINDCLLSQNTLVQNNIGFDWYINLYKDKEEFKKITYPFYNKYFDKISFLQDIQG